MEANAPFSLSDFENFDTRAPRGNRERRFLCLECGADKPRDSAHRSLAVNTQTGVYTCHRCGLKGKLSDYFEERPRQSRREINRLRLRAAFDLSPIGEKPQPKAGESEKVKATWASSQPIASTPGADYLSSRHIAVEIASAADVRYLSNYYGRPAVLFPMRDRAGELVAIEGRYIDGRDDPKTRSTGEKKLGVFRSAENALKAPSLVLVIVEGPLDALALEAVGLPSIALCGKVAPEWLLRVGALRPVLTALDADQEGDKASARIKADLIPLAAKVLRLRPRGAKDWAEALEKRGAFALRDALRGFSSSPLAGIPDELAGVPGAAPLEADDIRIREAKRLAKAGRMEEALFVTRLLEGTLEFRIAVERHLTSTVKP